jgi:hypothetical protein
VAALAVGVACWAGWTWISAAGIGPWPPSDSRRNATPKTGRDLTGRIPAPAVDPGPNFDGGYSESLADVSTGEALAHYALGAELLGFGDYYGAASHLALARDALGEYRRICEMLAFTYDQLNMGLDLAGIMDCLEREAREHESARLLFERLDRHLDVEVEFHAAASNHFVASFPAFGPTAGAIGDILAILEESRSRIAAELGIASVRIVPVVVYEGEQFSLAIDKPHWALGLYDGKIRIASDGLIDRPDLFDMAIAHEYVHALTHELTGVRLPAWIREGMADNLARPDLRDRQRLGAAAGALGTPLEFEELSGEFVEMSKEDAGRAYRQSFAMVHNLVREAGWGPVRDLLVALREAPDLAFEDAFEGIYGEMPADYFERWRRLILH